MNLLVAIPSRSNITGLEALLRQVDGIETVIYDNGHERVDGRPFIDTSARIVDARGWAFYKMWNDAWRYSKEYDYDAVALLNDDIVLHRDSLQIAFDALMGAKRLGIVGLNYERRVSEGADRTLPLRFASGARRNHGIGGHAFLLRSELWDVVPAIDEAYTIWFGDDELFYNVEMAGYALRVAMGAPVDHEESTTLRKHPELLALVDQDAQRFRDRLLMEKR